MASGLVTHGDRSCLAFLVVCSELCKFVLISCPYILAALTDHPYVHAMLRMAPQKMLKRSRKRRRKAKTMQIEAVQLLPDSCVEAHKSAYGEFVYIVYNRDAGIDRCASIVRNFSQM